MASLRQKPEFSLFNGNWIPDRVRDDNQFGEILPLRFTQGQNDKKKYLPLIYEKKSLNLDRIYFLINVTRIDRNILKT